MELLSLRDIDLNNPLYLMNKDNETLRFWITPHGVKHVELLNTNLLPEQLKIDRGLGLETWIRQRSMDLTRSYARMLLKQFRLSMNEFWITLANRVMTMTDTYWIRVCPEERFKDFYLQYREHDVDIFSTSLSGAFRDLPKIINTELTNIGSFNKGWVKEGNNWWLVKTGNRRSVYAEMFTHLLGLELGMDMATYKANGVDEVKSKNFTNENEILEHFASLKYRFSRYELDEEESLQFMESTVFSRAYRDMLLLDALVCNPDRHEFNFGIIRDSNNGEIIRLAPNFDNNLALGAMSPLSTYPIKMYINDIGMDSYQLNILSKIDLDLIQDLDYRTKLNIGDMNYYTTDVIEYFQNVLRGVKGI